MVLATEEKALLAFEPTRRIVPTTKTKITASITAYSAMSCPLSSLKIWGRILISLQFLSIVKTRTLGWQATFGSRTLNLIPLSDCAPAPTPCQSERFGLRLREWHPADFKIGSAGFFWRCLCN